MKIKIHRMTCRKADLFMLGFILLVSVLPADQVCAQYLGVTCGFQYSAQLTGPVTYPTNHDISLYNPDGGSQYATNCPTWRVGRTVAAGGCRFRLSQLHRIMTPPWMFRLGRLK